MGHTPLSNKEKISIFLPLMLAIALAGGTWLGFSLASNSRNSYVVVSEGGEYTGQTGKVEEILRFIDARYLENESINKLEDAAIYAVLNDLDPHSNYIPLDKIERINESLSGNFDGIGIEFFILDDTIYIAGVVADGPSDKAGIERGDKIIMIDDTLVSGEGAFNNKVVDKLKGKAGSKVTVKIQRSGTPELLDFEITRGQIPMHSLDIAYMLNETTGLIKLNRFSGTTYKEFMTALQNLVEKEDMQHLIVDLRGNPGGYLDAATKILDQLFSSRKLLVYTEGRSYNRKEYNSTGNNLFNISKVAVLIDESSASASEIIAGAIQDNDRGLIIGRRSFGKGLVQEQYKLTDGSALRLTVARYFTPSGRYIQKPYDGSHGQYDDDLQHRIESGELYNADSINITDSTIYRTTSGRIVHGGGGIVPDIFIPIDTSLTNPYMLAVSSYIRNYTYKYIDHKRQQLKERYPDFVSFNNTFSVSTTMLNGFHAYLEANNIELQNDILTQNQSFFELQMKSHIADQLFQEEGFYKTLFEKDDMILRAIQEINRNDSENTPSAMNTEE